MLAKVSPAYDMLEGETSEACWYQTLTINEEGTAPTGKAESNGE